MSIERCDLCGESRHITVSRQSRDGPLRNVICVHCGLVYVSPRPSNSATRSGALDGEYGRTVEQQQGPLRQLVFGANGDAAKRLKRIDSWLVRVEPRRVLDIGCGFGALLRLVRPLGCEPVGVEPDPTYASLAKELFDLDVHLDVFEVANLGEKPFGFIIASHVLEHVNSPSEFTMRVRQLLSPNGYAYFEVPSITRPYRGDVRQFFWSRHLTTFSPHTLRLMLQKCGLAIEANGWDGDFYWVIAKTGEYASERTRRGLRILSTLLQFHTKRIAYALGSKIPTKARENISYIQGLVRWVSRDPLGFLGVASRKLGRWVRPPGARSMNAPPKFAYVVTGSPERVHADLHAYAMEALFGWAVPGATLEVKRGVEGKTPTDSAVQGSERRPVAGSTANTASHEVAGACASTSLRSSPSAQNGFVVIHNHRSEDSNKAQSISSTFRVLEFHDFENTRQRSSRPDSALGLSLAQPCPLLLIGKLMGLPSPALQARKRSVVFYPSFDPDRSPYHSGDSEDRFMGHVSQALKWLQDDGWSVSVAAHSPADAVVIPWLQAKSIRAEVADLSNEDLDALIKFYHSQSVLVTTNRSVQELAVGLENAVIPLTTNDDEGGFVTELGGTPLSVADPDLSTKILKSSLDAIPRTVGDVEEAESVLWERTSESITLIRQYVNARSRQ